VDSLVPRSRAMYSYDRTAVLFTGKPPTHRTDRTVAELKEDTAELRGQLEKLKSKLDAGQRAAGDAIKLNGAIRRCNEILDALDRLS